MRKSVEPTTKNIFICIAAVIYPRPFFFSSLIPCRRIMSILFGIFFSLSLLFDVLNSCSTILSLQIFRVCISLALCVHTVQAHHSRSHTVAAPALLRMANRVFHCVLSTFSHRSQRSKWERKLFLLWDMCIARVSLFSNLLCSPAGAATANEKAF